MNGSRRASRVRSVARWVRGAGRLIWRPPPSAESSPPDLTNATAMFAWCLARGVSTRPHYLWPVLLASRIARSLDVERISIAEFGVAGGNGLLALERAAEAARSLTGVGIDIYGFDSASGMPEPVDQRDVPWAMRGGWFPMDEDKLRNRLRTAQLVLGPIAQTVPEWLRAARAPVGFLAFDLDYYSSTMAAFKLLEAPVESLLPRVPCYFDDIFGYAWSDFAGERAAIADFNRTHERRKIGPIYGLRYELPASEFTRAWPDQIYLAHVLDHPRYNTLEGKPANVWFEDLKLRTETADD